MEFTIRRNTPFHRIVSGYWCQGGDVTKFDGSGGTSIYGESFEKENFEMRHTGPGILSMCNNDEDRNDSKFNLTFRELKTADGDKVVFGRVIEGMVNLYKVRVFFRWAFVVPLIQAPTS
jgi:cyclophilin family peptidyl-prolyl cis-trans isomerase